MLDDVAKCRLPRAAQTRWNFHSWAVNTVYEHKRDLIECFQTILDRGYREETLMQCTCKERSKPSWTTFRGCVVNPFQPCAESVQHLSKWPLHSADGLTWKHTAEWLLRCAISYWPMPRTALHSRNTFKVLHCCRTTYSSFTKSTSLTQHSTAQVRHTR